MRLLSINIIIILSFLSCYENPIRDNPNDPAIWEIEYSEDGIYGENLLRESTISIALGTYYSLYAEIIGSYTVIVKLPDKLSPSFIWDYSSAPDPIIGWQLSTEGVKTVFTADTPGKYDCKIYFTGPSSGGYGEIEIYENYSAAPTRTKIITW